jgi:hypothetical protein
MSCIGLKMTVYGRNMLPFDLSVCIVSLYWYVVVYWRNIIHYTNLLLHNGMAFVRKKSLKKLIVAFHNVAMVPESLTTSRSVHWSCILNVTYVKWRDSNHHNFICIFWLFFKLVQGVVVSALQFLQRSSAGSVQMIDTFHRVNIKTILPFSINSVRVCHIVLLVQLGSSSFYVPPYSCQFPKFQSKPCQPYSVIHITTILHGWQP